MTKAPVLSSLLHRLGITMPASASAFQRSGGSSARHRPVPLSLLALAGVFALSATPAFGEITHKYETQITGPSPTTQFSRPWSLSFDASGNLFVADPGSSIIDAFDSSNHFITQVGGGTLSGGFTRGVAVDDKTGDVYVADSNRSEVFAFQPKGATPEAGYEPLAQWKESPFGSGCCYLYDAVDNHAVEPADERAGDVYVLSSNGTVYVVKPEGASEGKVVGELSAPGAGPLSGLAVDAASGNVYVATPGTHVVEVFNDKGEEQPLLALTGSETPQGAAGFQPTAVAIDDADKVVYVIDGEARAVDEFSMGGAWLGQITQTTAGKRLAEPLGVAVQEHAGASQGEVYVSDGATRSVDVFAAAGVVPPDVTTGAASAVTPTSATLNGTVNPAEVPVSECRFEYRTSEEPSFAHSAPCSPAPGSGNAPVAVSAALSGLTPLTRYHFRLSAANANATNSGSEATFFTPAVPLVKASVSHVTATSATLEAQINPLGSDTTYYFQYGLVSCASSPASCTSVPAPPVDVGAGETSIEVMPSHLRDLEAGATYHYRVVAQSAFGTSESPDQTFTTQTAGVFALPDARAWELVSPPDKHGSLIVQISGKGVTQAAADGEAITYLAKAPTESEPPGNSNQAQVLSARGGAATAPWMSRDISTPREVANGFDEGGAEEPRFFSADLSLAVIQPWGAFMPSLSSEASEQTAYLRTNFVGGSLAAPCSTDCYRPLVTGASGFANVPEGTEFGEGTCHPEEEIRECGPFYEGASPDGSHVILRSSTPLAKGAPTNSLYEWAGGRVTLVSILPASEGGGPVTGILGTVGIGGGLKSVVKNAVSADGSRVVWSREVGAGRVYVRDVARGETVLLGASAEFQTASSDGTRVVFTEAGDLKMFEAPLGGPLAAGHVTDLIPGANIIGVMPGASEDGSSIYFVSDAVLTTAPNPRGEHAAAGTCGGPEEHALCDLYLWRGGQIKLVAVLSNEDNPVWQPGGDSYGPTARVSPNGEWLAFMSDRSLTGYDNRDVSGGAADEEVFLYSSPGGPEAGRLVCASCDPTGSRPHGAFDHGTVSVALPGDNQRVWAGQWLAGNVPGWTSPSYQASYLSNEGRLFFNSNDALVPSDSGGTEDVYEYEPPGVGSCTSAGSTFSPRSSGCIDLISSGTAKEGAAFLDASESGNDVFFLTSAQLSAQDLDTLPDVYDARVGGGVAPVQPMPACEGDACQSPASAPNDPTPGSLTFVGPGNVTPIAPRTPAGKPASRVKAEKLAKALKACRRLKSKTRRRACERQAKRKYAAARNSTAGKATNRRRAK